MNNFLLIFFLIIFAGMPAYYLTFLYSIYYKKIFKNKDNLKLEYTTSSLNTYISSIILLIVSIMFAIYTFMNNITSYYLITVIIINIIVFFSIKLSCTKFAIYDNYVVVKNNYGEFNEIQSLLLEKKDKENTYELKLTTKYDLLICSIMTENPKDILKSIKTNLPKNIKIKELSAK